MALIVNSNERQIARIGMTSRASDEILGLDTNADFHGRPTNIVDARLQHDEVAQMNGFPKVYAIDRRRDTRRSCVANRSDRRSLVHECHDHAAKYVSEIVCIRWQHERRRLVL